MKEKRYKYTIVHSNNFAEGIKRHVPQKYVFEKDSRSFKNIANWIFYSKDNIDTPQHDYMMVRTSGEEEGDGTFALLMAKTSSTGKKTYQIVDSLLIEREEIILDQPVDSKV